MESPVLGWDLFRKHRIDFRWNDFGDVVIWDPKAQITAALTFKSMPHQQSAGNKDLTLSRQEGPRGRVGQAAEELHAQVAAMQDLGEENEDINILPDSPYKQLLSKYPELLKQS